jgi:hypothetical protein
MEFIHLRINSIQYFSCKLFLSFTCLLLLLLLPFACAKAQGEAKAEGKSARRSKRKAQGLGKKRLITQFLL